MEPTEAVYEKLNTLKRDDQPDYADDPTHPERREVWRARSAPAWAVPIEEVERLVALHAASMPEPVYGDDGKELPGSKVRRAGQAVVLERAAGREPVTYGQLRAEGRIAKLTPEQLAAERAQAEQEFWSGLPEAVEKMGVGKRHVDQLADLDETWPAMKFAKEWVQQTRGWLCFLGGDPGVGKTQAIAWALAQLAVQKFGHGNVRAVRWRTDWGLYIPVADVCNGPAFGPKAEERMESLRAVKYLALDDLGAEMDNKLGVELLVQLLDHRHRNKMKTMLATNLKTHELHGRYSARLLRRLTDDSFMRKCEKPA